MPPTCHLPSRGLRDEGREEEGLVPPGSWGAPVEGGKG